MDKISVAAALLAAGLWLWSALVQIPLLSVGWGGVTIADHPFYRAMRKTARLNAAAAICHSSQPSLKPTLLIVTKICGNFRILTQIEVTF